MLERREVLKQFEEHKEEVNKRISEGIEKYRKGTARIKITDKDGNPVKNLKIKAVQKTHEFKYGANLFMLDELETEEKNKKYKEYFKDAFNIATLPFYWSDLEPEKGKPRYAKDSEKIYRRPTPDLCLEFCEENGIEAREHALAYEHFFPKWLKDKDVDTVKKEFERRCKEISERYADKIPIIEVTNETWWDNGETALYDENDFVEYCFGVAEKYFPNNKLGINEYQGLWDKATNRAWYYLQIERTLKNGVRIDEIGMQFHMFFKAENELKETKKYYNPLYIYKVLDRYSDFKKPIEITEVTIPAYTYEEEDEEIQAQIIKNLYSVWFSHPSVDKIIYWNLVDGYAAFAPQGDMTSGENYYRGGLLRFDFTPKKSYYVIKDLFSKIWHTEELVICDNGIAEFKGFYGDYELELDVNGKKEVKKITLSKNKENVFDIII